MVKIKIIIGSTRPNRFGPKPAQWVLDLAKTRSDAEFELVDLEDIGLPLYNEPESAKTRNYVHEYTKKWSQIVEEADGFIFVTPEYNHSTSAALKNALDYLYFEWNYKPVSYVSYGGPAGGSRAVEHLRGVAAELKMFDLREQVVISNYWDMPDQDDGFKSTEEHIRMATLMLNELVFWTQKIQPARAEQQKLAAAK